MLSIANFARDHTDDIDALDLNPVIVHPHGQGVSVVDTLLLKATPASDASQQTRG